MAVLTDDLYTDYYPYPAGAGGGYQPLQNDMAPLQPQISAYGGGSLGLSGPALPQGHHVPLLVWALVIIGGTFVFMHVADRA